jgi:hypothetical protein
MAHYKKRKRRRGGIKGCCWMCSLRTTDGRRNGRLRTKQELSAPTAKEFEAEEVAHGRYPDWDDDDGPFDHEYWYPGQARALDLFMEKHKVESARWNSQLSDVATLHKIG